MKLIESFSVNHMLIIPGIFVSREDTVGNSTVTTYDIRLKKPNREPVIDVAAMHSLEHIIATFLRNNSDWKDQVIYWGPMGCLTGMYIIMTGEYSVEDMRQLTIECLEWIIIQDKVPATEPQTCGNYLLHDLPMCKWECRRYLDRLRNDFHSEYEKLQVVLGDGKVFADA